MYSAIKRNDGVFVLASVTVRLSLTCMAVFDISGIGLFYYCYI